MPGKKASKTANPMAAIRTKRKALAKMGKKGKK